MKTAWCWLFCGLLFGIGRSAEPAHPLPAAHAHNDYAHPRPLLDALDQGFCSVEADIHLVDGRLLVAHDAWQVKPERTLQALYLDPLRDRAQANGGRVHPGGPPFHLLIDFKTPAETTWAALRPVLDAYADLLTEFTASTTQVRAVTIILSGNSPRQQVAALPRRLAGIDGRLPDLDANPSPHLVPWLSENWNSHFKWRGAGALSPEDATKLAGIIRRAHEQGRKVRFWGAPDTEAIWRVQRDAGVDFINTDKLAELRKFLATTPATADSADARRSADTFTVATFNIFHGNPNLPGIARAIADTEADLVCLQETNPASERYLRREFANRYPHMMFGGGVDQDGMAVLSTTPLTALEFVPPKHGLFGSWLFHTPLAGSYVQFALVHLQPPDVLNATSVAALLRNFDRAGETQTQEISALWERLHPNQPRVVLGDFNSFASGPAMSFLRDQGMRNSTEALPEGATRKGTWSPPVFGFLPNLRIDHLLHSRHFATIEERVIATEASDHRPLVVTLRLI